MSELAALREAVKVAGGQSALARAVNVRQGHVWSWLNRSKRVDARYAIPVEEKTGVSRHKLRPDIFGKAQ